MTTVSLRALSAAVDGTTILDTLDLDVTSGEVLGIVGPNGSGKSTALRCVYRALRPTSGVVRVDSTDVWATKPRDVARQVAALTQDSGSELDFTVAELVELGRAPHRRGNAALTARERDVCQAAMLQMGVLHLADRGVLGLSGGERQRVLIARALAQEPQLLVLDEPTNHLDLRHQLELLRALRRVAATTLVVLHDLNLAAAACDRLALLSRGRLVAVGLPSEVLTPELLAAVYGIEVSVVEHPETGHPQVLLTIDSPDPPRAHSAPADSEGFR